jgi:cysteine sulfinate desulfinase/cysteine desulfurase-like protein
MWYYCAVTGESKKIVFTSGATEKITGVLFLYSCQLARRGNGFSTHVVVVGINLLSMIGQHPFYYVTYCDEIPSIKQ